VRFRPDTIMPQFFPDGESAFTQFAGGDAKAQLHAMWEYLALGRNTRQPSGMTRPSMEILVGENEAVMLRRSAPDIGKRGISVGYPKKVNITFDAERVVMHHLWRGQFIDPAGVWSGQGSGRVRIIPREKVHLAGSPAFATLTTPKTRWPTASARSLGYRFRGYDLDAQRRPTFRYDFGDAQIQDKCEDHADANGVAYLVRTIRVRGAKGNSLYFRVAHGSGLEEGPNHIAIVDRRVSIHAQVDGQEALCSKRTSTVSDEVRDKLEARAKERNQPPPKIPPVQELVIPVPLKNGAATIRLEYRWLEASK
ncbi:MAG: hypothetical protein AAF517_00485, partial [Planctomycetota bacterium]